MTAYFTKEQTQLLSSRHLSRYEMVDVRPVGLGARLSSLVQSLTARLRGMPSRHAVLRDLNRLTDRELADIGLTRGELHRVFDPNFVPNRGLA